MTRKLSMPVTVTIGLLVVLLAFLVPKSTANAKQPQPLSVQPSALHAQTTLSETQPVSGTTLTPVDVQPTTPVTVTVIVTVTAPPLTATPAPVTQLPIVELLPNEVLTATIIANRTDSSVFFFLDDDLYLLPPNRATGLQLDGPLAGLTLFTCAADVTDNAACDWISHPIRRAAFYEISAEPATPEPANLRLATAGPPPLDIALIQNRTGADGWLLLSDALIEIENTAVSALDVDDSQPNLLYLPRCLHSNSQRICEWLPTPFNGGVYYALRENRKPAGINGVTVSQSELEPLLLQETLTTPTPTPESEPQGVLCQTQIPSLNVRGGPGTEYLIIGKLRTGEENRGRVLAVGRSENSEWLAVDPRFVEGGWVANAVQWIVCDGTIDDLPIAEITDGRPAAPTPVPVRAIEPTPTPETEQSETEQPPAEAQPAEPDGPTSLGPEQAMLIASNRSEHPLRFTLDAALHGLPEGTPSEYDLEPGQSVQFIIRAGRVQFSASTAWRDGSGNAEFDLGEGATRELFLHFILSETGTDRWVMRYE